MEKVLRFWLATLQKPLSREKFVSKFCFTVDVKRDLAEEVLDKILEKEHYPNLINSELEMAA